MVRSIGANRVIDHTREDFTQDAERYDLLLDNVGSRSLSACQRVLKPDGMLVIAGAPKNMGAALTYSLKVLALSRFTCRTLMFLAHLDSTDLATIAELTASGKVTPVIERRYTLPELPQAIRYAIQGHARGKLVVMIGDKLVG